MENTSKPETGSPSSNGGSRSDAAKHSVLDSEVSQGEVVAPASPAADVVDQKVIAKSNARYAFERYVSPGIASPGDEFLEAFAEYDPRSNRIQRAELWRFQDRSFSRKGRF